MKQLTSGNTAQVADKPAKIRLGIRDKIVLPYLVLTFAVAILGVYLATVLVTDSLEERFSNQLADTGLSAADGFRELENNHLALWRILAATEGMPEAVTASDPERTRTLVEGPLASLTIDSVLVINTDAALVAGLDRSPNGTFEPITLVSLPTWDPLSNLLSGQGDPSDRTTGILLLNGQPYIFTIAGLSDDNDVFVGVIMVGTRLDHALRDIREKSLAHISVYALNGELYGTTLPDPIGDERPNIVPEQNVQEIIARGEPTSPGDQPESLVESLQRGSAEYRLIYGVWQVRDDIVGIYSVALESNFVVSRTVTSRLTFALIFSAMIVVVLIIGIFLSRLLIRPILRLVRTTQAIAEGDLSQRTDVVSSDEIGTLAIAFDDMTTQLQKRTLDLEKLLQAHKEEATKTHAIVSSIADGVLVIDPQGKIIMMNHAAARILGDMAQDFSAGMFREQPTEKSNGGKTSLSQALTTIDNNSTEERRFELNQRVISTLDAPVITNDGQKLGTVVVMRDVTMEVEVDRMKDQFIEQISHELRTPLTPIKGFLDLMLQTATGDLSEKYIDFLNIIDRHVDSLIAMITELLDVSQLNAGSMRLRMERIALNELIEVSVTDWAEKIAEKGQQIDLQYDPQSTEIVGDRRRLGWAIKQLISNAYHYTEPGGRITIKVERNDTHASIQVADTGIGISDEDKKYLFTRFFRSTSRIHSNERGVGLGLYIVKSVVDAHRGNVSLMSKVDQGSTFSIELPLDEPIGEPPYVDMVQTQL